MVAFLNLSVFRAYDRKSWTLSIWGETEYMLGKFPFLVRMVQVGPADCNPAPCWSVASAQMHIFRAYERFSEISSERFGKCLA